MDFSVSRLSGGQLKEQLSAAVRVCRNCNYLFWEVGIKLGCGVCGKVTHCIGRAMAILVASLTRN